MISLVQLECFIAVAEELHFGAAASRLKMTQPPLSRQIQQLERELETQLFSRTSRRVELTQAGRALLPSARRLIDLAAKAVADVKSVGKGAAGTLTIAYTAMAGQAVIPRLMRRASTALPDVSLLLREMVTLEQVDAIEKGTVDVGLVRPLLSRPQLESRPVYREKLVVAVPSDSVLAERGDPARLIDLLDEPLLMYSPGVARYFHDLLLSMFVASGVHPRISQYAGQIPTLLALVSAGLGVALVPESASRICPDTVALLPVSEKDPSDRVNRVELDIAWSRETQNPLVPAILALIDEEGGDVAIDALGA
ncbi:MAG: LysR family transcriptional regulator [Microbacterium gubbeenense]|uniref:LysR family transcriptional regulator n=2 Tax=Microbacteriaceae TaxID=85023 RepID=UPI00055BC151|nr:LysR family transcriptional regulator [Microbacterium gubbeenense]